MSAHEDSPAAVPYDEHTTKATNPQHLSAEAIAPNAVKSSETSKRSDGSDSQSIHDTMQELLRKKLKKNDLEDNLKEIIKIWDFESGMTAQTPDVFKCVEKILEIDHITLSETWRRQEFTISMVRRTLREILRTYGYVEAVNIVFNFMCY
jgi:hypothetical protein